MSKSTDDRLDRIIDLLEFIALNMKRDVLSETEKIWRSIRLTELGIEHKNK